MSNTECVSHFLVNDTIERSTSFSRKKSPFDSFFSLEPTQLRVKTYLDQFLEYLDISEYDIALSVILLDRFINSAEMQITGENWQLLSAVSLLTAEELLNDEPHSPRDFSTILRNYSTDEIMNCEVEFCEGLDWHLYVDANEILDFVECKEVICNTALLSE